MTTIVSLRPRVKFFTTDDAKSMEYKVNQWFEKNEHIQGVKVKDIKYTDSVVDQTGTERVSCMVWYEDHERRKEWFDLGEKGEGERP